ncbi:MAG TPA: hypothetical protein VFA26_15255 [Gemmataceae bacterium]|nr:hypothetical protein [Gemmataceae bacterium]
MRPWCVLLLPALADGFTWAGQLPPEAPRGADLKAPARAFVAALAGGDHAACAKTCDHAMKKALPADKLTRSGCSSSATAWAR